MIQNFLARHRVVLGAGIIFSLAAGIAKAETLVGFGEASRIYTLYTFSQTIFTGECPGSTDLNAEKINDEHLLVHKSLIEDGSIPAPQEDRKVRILNRSNGAYKDRKWEPKYQQEGLEYVRSKDFDIKIGSKHTKRNFRLLEGENDLTAIFYDGKKYDSESRIDLAQYDFTMNTAINEKTAVRDRRFSDLIVECAADPSIKDRKITDENCPGDRQQVQYLQCPDGSGGTRGRQRFVQGVIRGPKSSPAVIIVQ